jgi:hypothetical protein
MNHGKTTSVKRNSGRKSTLSGRHCRTLRKIVPKNHRTAAAQVKGQQSLIFFLKPLFPQNIFETSFPNPTSTVGPQLVNL